MLNKDVLELLACPDCDSRPPLEQTDEQTLRCTLCGRLFEINDGIINLMPAGLLDQPETDDD